MVRDGEDEDVVGREAALGKSKFKINKFKYLIQSPSEARGLGNENGRSRRNHVVGGLGGFPPIIGRT